MIEKAQKSETHELNSIEKLDKREKLLEKIKWKCTFASLLCVFFPMLLNRFEDDWARCFVSCWYGCCSLHEMTNYSQQTTNLMWYSFVAAAAVCVVLWKQFNFSFCVLFCFLLFWFFSFFYSAKFEMHLDANLHFGFPFAYSLTLLASFIAQFQIKSVFSAV